MEMQLQKNEDTGGAWEDVSFSREVGDDGLHGATVHDTQACCTYSVFDSRPLGLSVRSAKEFTNALTRCAHAQRKSWFKECLSIRDNRRSGERF